MIRTWDGKTYVLDGYYATCSANVLTRRCGRRRDDEDGDGEEEEDMTSLYLEEQEAKVVCLC